MKCLEEQKGLNALRFQRVLRDRNYINIYLHNQKVKSEIIMGLKGGGTITFTLSGISLADLYTIGKNRSSKCGHSIPAIDVDLSWLGYHWCLLKSGPVGHLLDFASALYKECFHVIFVADSDRRSSIKQVSTQRLSERYYKQQVFIQAMTELLYDRTCIRDVQYIASGDKAAIDVEIKSLEKNYQFIRQGKQLHSTIRFI